MRKRIAVLMGGYTAERHISLESGRNIYNKLAASAKYDVIPLFLSGSPEAQHIFTLPTFLLLKDNADDIHNFLLHPTLWEDTLSLLDPIRAEAHALTDTYAKHSIHQPEILSYSALKKRVDFVFIALHGRPGEDGTLQRLLEQYAIPYNGSGIQTAALTIDKYATNQFLKQQGFHVAQQVIITKQDWDASQTSVISSIERNLVYPLIVKPVDDGCSSGVRKITDRALLQDYITASFNSSLKGTQPLGLSNDLPQSAQLLIENCIEQDPGILHLLEITVGLLTRIDANRATLYELFEPSEVLAANTILTLEEKFLAGEGHNITPARFHKDPAIAKIISQMVQAELKKVAQKLNLQGYARIDAFVKIYPNQKIEVWIIEVNSLPAMTPATCIFHQCARNGYTPFHFIDAIIQYGFTKRNFEKNTESVVYA
ncbi:D-alanine--D-alanine ligase family protein [Candidatus Cardinium hertigii]|uniref:D-alanine--D-alanine ligase family protein n=1 Tax=Candidatus Cardinium hertigii TaxID=247481 RepID=UPI000D70863A|nr:hypothetical protein [Candidatus Cardinium hertigii]